MVDETAIARIRMIVGLGNVGAGYERTRHNAGFWLIDRFASRVGARLKPERKFSADLARTTIDQRDQILIAHDELDLPPGEARLKLGGGTAGHNGLKDVKARLTHADFWRARIG